MSFEGSGGAPVAEKELERRRGSFDEVEAPDSRAARLACWFGGKHTVVGPRICPVREHLRSDGSDSDDSASTILTKQKELEDGHAIQYRTCSWQKACRLRPRSEMSN